MRARALRAIHRHHHDRRVVDVGIVRICVLERPAAGPDIGPARAPVAFDAQDLLRQQPFETFAGLGRGAIAADFEQGVTGERGIPNRRDARLAIALVLVHDQKLLDRFACDRPLGMVFRIAKRVEHHHAVRHRRENGAETILTVESLRNPRRCALDRALSQTPAKRDATKDEIDAAEEPKPQRFLLRRLRRETDRARRLEEKLLDGDPLGVARSRLERLQHQQRHEDGATPIGNLIEVERKPFRQQHDLDRHHRNRAPGDEIEKRQHHPREHVRARGAAARANGLPRADHVGGVDGVTDHLEREIGFHARAHIEGAVVE